MDIELTLRELLVLENPGPRFTDGVMSRVADAAARQLPDNVARLAEARLRKRSRRILLGTLLAVGAAASMLRWMLPGPANVPELQQTSMAEPVVESPHVDPQPALAQSAASTGSGDLPQCVDPDVLRGLMLQLPDQGFRIGVAMPPELATFKAPRQFSWLGSTERSQGENQSTAVVYRTGLAGNAAGKVLAEALAAGGWKQRPDAFPTTNVFTALQSRSGETYCRDGKPVNASASALDGVTYVVLSVSRTRASASDFTSACELPQQAAMRPASTLDQYMPKLELPLDPATGQPVRMQGGGGGNGEVKRRMNVSFTLKDTVDNVARHFARQMAEQGWSTDASWSGSGTAGSSWTRTGDAGTVLQATLTVSAFNEGAFTAGFQVVTTK